MVESGIYGTRVPGYEKAPKLSLDLLKLTFSPFNHIYVNKVIVKTNFMAVDAGTLSR